MSWSQCFILPGISLVVFVLWLSLWKWKVLAWFWSILCGVLSTLLFYAIQSIPIPLLLFYSPLRYEKNVLKNPQFVQEYTLLLSRQPAWTLQYSFNCQTAIFQGHLSFKKIYLERSHFSLIDFLDPQNTYHGNCALWVS